MRLIYTGYVCGDDGFFEYRWATTPNNPRRACFRKFISLIRFDSELRDKCKLEQGERNHAPLHDATYRPDKLLKEKQTKGATKWNTTELASATS